ncbi:unnamed protein product [Polarella glacialis]|uniref:ABC transporter domain-containing protein n=1 Tax=Polarella glacialis TaxID=89957 RepID=A0A813JBM1_POLGL|nr:unnamed protein product [Polarella glacialis]
MAMVMMMLRFVVLTAMSDVASGQPGGTSSSGPSGSASKSPSWWVGAISSDLGCSKNAALLLLAGNQTQCSATEIYTGLASVGECVACSSAPKGPGYYCQDNTAVLCPNGHYCPDYLTKAECPKGTWCRAGFVQPEDCSFVISCPQGSEKQLAGPGLLFGLILFLVCICSCSCCFRIRAVREQEHIRDEAAKIQDGAVVLGQGLGQTAYSVAIEFEDVGMKLKSNGLDILSGITGKFPAGSLVALMGPSGGGKTTFMNALCGRASYGTIRGSIKINGKAGSVQDFPKLVGYVPQDDIMHADLTVHQNLYFNAQLRLPAGTSSEQVLEHVNKTIKVLGLEHVAHNLVGSAERRGISGGQKKRVNIGMELAAMPAVIFMDEPTSGLDGAATIQLARCLSELSRSGLTIICVIHQPRWAVFDCFTHLLLLGEGGRMVYSGQAKMSESYFDDTGFRLPPRENPADWMIDIVCGMSPRYQSKSSDDVDAAFAAPHDLFELWDSKCKAQNPYEDSSLVMGEPLRQDRSTPGRLKQTWIFLVRNARQWNKVSFLSTLALLFLCGAVFGLLMTSIATFSYGAMFAMLTGNGFIFFMITTVNSRSVFGFERLQYLREFKSGTSSGAYWLAKITFDLINVFMYSLAYSLPLFWLQPLPAMSYGQYLVVFIMSAWYHSGLGMLFSVTFSSTSASLLLCVFAPMVLQLAFAGTLIKISDMSAGQKALSSISCGRWYNQELYIRELQHFPEHTHKFPEVVKQLASIQADLDDAGVGILNLAILGLLLRIWALIVLALLKYSEGGNCITQLRFVAGKHLRHLGLVVGPSPKPGDVVVATVTRSSSSLHPPRSVQVEPAQIPV